MANQRKTSRVPLDIYLNKYLAGVPYTARASDISPEGLSVSPLSEPQHQGTRVGLQFQLPGWDEVIYAEGEVVHGGEGPEARGAGVRFTLLTNRHRKMIQSFVEARLELGA